MEYFFFTQTQTGSIIQFPSSNRFTKAEIYGYKSFDASGIPTVNSFNSNLGIVVNTGYYLYQTIPPGGTGLINMPTRLQESFANFVILLQSGVGAFVTYYPPVY
jgi:hypothetical protein